MNDKTFRETPVRVSFIVPAYNAEPYIEQCVTSILNQTVPQIEVLIINDGSSDHTGALIDAMAKKDARIRVFHQANQGVSASRNIGIESAVGDYLVFVDADDYLAEDYALYMLTLAEKTGTPFCFSENCFTQVGEEQVSEETMKTLSSADATAMLLSPYVVVGCWNKIFKRTWIWEQNMRFSTDLFYGEGLSFITKAAQKAEYVGMGNRKVYYYRRNNELSATTVFRMEKFRNGEHSLNRIREDIHTRNERTDAMYALHYCTFCLGAVVKIKQNHMVKPYREDYRRYLSYLRSHIGELFKSPYISLYRKCMLLGGCISPGLMAYLDFVRRKKISEKSV